jgi:hypothetical protein
LRIIAFFENLSFIAEARTSSVDRFNRYDTMKKKKKRVRVKVDVAGQGQVKRKIEL